MYRVQCTIKVFLLFFVFYTLFFTLYTSPVHAQENKISEARINPASPLYFLKAVQEVIELRFADSAPKKALRELEFANRRISEVKSLMATSRQDLIEPTLNQYLFYLGEMLGAANLDDRSLAEKITRDMISHMNFLQQANTGVSDPRANRSIRATITSLSKWDLQLIDRLNKSKNAVLSQKIIDSRLTACGFLAKEASNSALNEVERAVFSERAEICPTQKL